MAPESFTDGLSRESSTVVGILLLLSVWLVTGTLVTAAFVLPETVGALISGQALLALGMVFAGVTLSLLAVVPGTGHSLNNRNAADSRRPVYRRDVDVESLDSRFRLFLDELDTAVVYPVVFVVLFSVIGSVAFPSLLTTMVDHLETIVLETGRTVLHVAVFVFVIGVLWLALGETGRIRLGGDDVSPEYGDGTYLAMLFSAGIAAGIVFWGPAEALFHYETVPPVIDAEPGTTDALVGALQTTLFHWGISAWSAYLVIALPIAYAVYNLDASPRVSAVLAPWLGVDIVERPLGKLVDVLAVVATLGGLSTTLGFLSAQFLTGIEFRWGVELATTAQILFIGGLTGIVLVSVAAGIRQGMGRFSLLNSSVFLIVLVMIGVVGPTLAILDTGIQALVAYVLGFVPMSFYTGDTALAILPGVPSTEGGEWLSGWTSFYWAWWLSWAPFVGLFIARISRGRRIRTVVLAAGIVTSVATLTWFVIVGATALHIQHTGAVDLLGVILDVDESVAGYPLFDTLPVGTFLLVPFLLLVITFFITSADAATRSLALMMGRTDNPSTLLQSSLAASIGLIAMGLILFGDGGIVQSAATVTGGPFAIVGLVALFGLILRLRSNE